YRPSLKNRQRWTFGGLYPEAYCETHRGEVSGHQLECLVAGTGVTTIEVVVRFLHLTTRLVGEVTPPLAAWPEDLEPPSRPVEFLRAGDRIYQKWQEAEEREVGLGEMTLGELSSVPRNTPFTFSAWRRAEPVLGSCGEVVGVVIREQQAIAGIVELEATEV